MNAEFEKTSSPIELTPTQAGVKKKVLKSLNHSKKNKRIVIIQGISGVGKSVVMEQVASEKASRDQKIGEGMPDIHSFLSEIKENKEYRGGIVAMSPADGFAIEEHILRAGFEVARHRLPGMSQKEIEKVYKKSKEYSLTTLSQEQVIQYSLGVPTLMKQILDHADSEEKAAELAAIYLKENLSPFFGYTSFDIYLKILPSPKTLEYLDKENVKSAESSIRSFIKKVKEEWTNIKDKKEILKEPPLPKAKSTETIYAKTLLITNEERVVMGAMTDIRILAPSIDEKTYQKILKILGMTGKSDGFEKSNWPQLFKVDDDRLSLVGVSGNNITSHHGRRASKENREHLQEIESLKERAKLAGVGEEKNHDNVLYLNYTDHSNISSKAALAGLMFEILLQRLNVPYYVNNRYCGKEYQYDPETNKITMPLSEQLEYIQNILVKSGLSGIEQELIKRGIDEKNIKTHLDKKPSERQLIFGDPSKVKLESLPNIITKLMEGELDKERQRTLERIKSDFEWSGLLSLTSAKFYLDKLKREALESLREATYDSDDVDIAKILDLSTDYIVLDKLSEETREKIG